MGSFFASSFFRQVIIPIAGFGFGGLLWGLEAYRGTVGSDDVFVNPFSFILGAIALGIFGGFSLVAFSGDWKKIARVVFFGTLGWVAAFLIPAIWVYELWLVGGAVFLFPELVIDVAVIDSILSLSSIIEIGSIWLEFLLTGLIVGLTYVYLFKKSVKSALFFQCGGFMLSAFLGPIAGNIIGEVFHSILLSYLVTFILIGIIIGWGLSRSSYAGQNATI